MVNPKNSAGLALILASLISSQVSDARNVPVLVIPEPTEKDSQHVRVVTTPSKDPLNKNPASLELEAGYAIDIVSVKNTTTQLAHKFPFSLTKPLGDYQLGLSGSANIIDQGDKGYNSGTIGLDFVVSKPRFMLHIGAVVNPIDQVEYQMTEKKVLSISPTIEASVGLSDKLDLAFTTGGSADFRTKDSKHTETVYGGFRKATSDSLRIEGRLYYVNDNPRDNQLLYLSPSIDYTNKDNGLEFDLTTMAGQRNGGLLNFRIPLRQENDIALRIGVGATVDLGNTKVIDGQGYLSLIFDDRTRPTRKP